MEPSMVRYHKKCDEFSICCEVGDKGVIFLENAEERRTLYQIIVRGSGKMAKVFDSEYLIGDSINNNFLDLKKYMGCHTVFESTKPFFIYGFNTLDPQQDWDGKLISDSFDGDDKSYLICFYGNPVINGVKLESRNYAKLENKHYDVKLNKSIVGVFTKL